MNSYHKAAARPHGQRDKMPDLGLFVDQLESAAELTGLARSTDTSPSESAVLSRAERSTPFKPPTAARTTKRDNLTTGGTVTAPNTNKGVATLDRTNDTPVASPAVVPPNGVRIDIRELSRRVRATTEAS